MQPGFVPTPRQEQAISLLEAEGYKYYLLAGGSRSGKTALLCYMVAFRAHAMPSRHAILRYHFSDVKQSVALDTLPKILKMMGIPYQLNRSDWYFTVECENGGSSEIWISGLDDNDRVEKILGKEFSTIYLNEASQISYHAFTTALTRLAENAGLRNRVFIDCNPPEKSHWLYQMFVLGRQPGTELPLASPEKYGMLQMNPADNPHLPPDYLETLQSLPERQKKRFLYGEWLDKRAGALFSAEAIEAHRVTVRPPDLLHAVVGVDPAVTSSETSDETGIVSVALSSSGDFYILRDDSLKGSPASWGRAVADAYDVESLDSAVYESNQGGDMVQHTIKTADPRIPCHAVRATRGKVLRAEPVAALYEQGRVHHVGRFPVLEDQMTSWTPEDADSPDRLDALVWAVTYLVDNYTLSSVRAWNDPTLGSCSIRPPMFGGGLRR